MKKEVMWTIVKVDKRKIDFLMKEFKEKLGNDVKFYMPKLRLKKFFKKKFFFRESLMLGDYLLCFHKDFSKKSVLSSLKYCRGLKYFLYDFLRSQKEIENFVTKCKKNEDEDGFIKQTFFEFKNKVKYEFISGPFTSLIFSILNENNSNIQAIIGKYKATVSKEGNLFRPVQ